MLDVGRRRLDAPHRHLKIDFDVSMPHIDVSKSISTSRCPTSTSQNPFRRLDAPHRRLKIHFDASMPHIDVSKSISTSRCPTSTYQQVVFCRSRRGITEPLFQTPGFSLFQETGSPARVSLPFRFSSKEREREAAAVALVSEDFSSETDPAGPEQV